MVMGNLFGNKVWPLSRLPGHPSKRQRQDYFSSDPTIIDLRPADQTDGAASRVFKRNSYWEPGRY